MQKNIFLAYVANPMTAAARKLLLENLKKELKEGAEEIIKDKAMETVLGIKQGLRLYRIEL